MYRNVVFQFVLNPTFDILFISGLQRDTTTPRFSGMNLGDVMKVTVMEEMKNLKMNRNEPLDLSNKPWNLSKKTWWGPSSKYIVPLSMRYEIKFECDNTHISATKSEHLYIKILVDTMLMIVASWWYFKESHLSDTWYLSKYKQCRQSLWFGLNSRTC